jgi:hypothetical protein
MEKLRHCSCCVTVKYKGKDLTSICVPKRRLSERRMIRVRGGLSAGWGHNTDLF